MKIVTYGPLEKQCERRRPSTVQIPDGEQLWALYGDDGVCRVPFVASKNLLADENSLTDGLRQARRKLEDEMRWIDMALQAPHELLGEK